MPEPLIAGLPPDLVLSAGYVIRITALDATTGNTVDGVQLTDISLFVTQLSGPRVESDQTQPLLVPSTEV